MTRLRVPALSLLLFCFGCGPEVTLRTLDATPSPCISNAAVLPLLGAQRDSPLVGVEVDRMKAAMFFSPGFAPLLLRRNGPFWFSHDLQIRLQTQDGGTIGVWPVQVRDFAVEPFAPRPQSGLLLAGRETREVDGRPIIGMIGRQALAANAVVDLDIPRRRAVFAVLRAPRCPDYQRLLNTSPLPMRRDLLTVGVSINGHPTDAVLEPDLPVSVIPRSLAPSFGVSTEGEVSVRTRYGARVRGRRERIRRLTIGDVVLEGVTADVEDGVTHVMLGLNVFGRGEAVFDFEKGQFWFHVLTDKAPESGGLHFDETKIAHTEVQQDVAK